MDLYGIGFSNIRFASEDANYIHRYNNRGNIFAQEVFVHEYLHTLERTSKEFGFETVDLHEHEKYGYKDGSMNGLKEWYEDYLRCKIIDKNTNKYIGLNDKVYVLKPVNETNFKFPVEVNFNDEPENILEEIKSLFNVVTEAI